LVHFLHIGKTGGSALKHAFRAYPPEGRYQVVFHKHGVRLRDIREGEAFMFLVRDPISRFVSGFYSRQREGRPRRVSPWSPEEKAAFERFATPNELAVAITSPEVAERKAAHAAMSGIAHVRSSYWLWFEDEAYFRSRASDLFFIGFQERLSEDFEILRSRLGLPEEARLPFDATLAHRNPENLDKRLSTEAVENLERWYARDFEFLACCRELIDARPEIRARDPGVQNL
jgi:hypothetical protein